MKSVRSVAMVVGAFAASVVAIAVVLQTGELSVPPVRSCEVHAVRAVVAPVLGVQAPARTSALTGPPVLGRPQAGPHPQPLPAAQAQARARVLERCLAEVSSRQSSALEYGWIAALAVLAVGAGLGIAAGKSSRRTGLREIGSGSPTSLTGGAGRVSRVEANGRAAGTCARERAILATACIEVSDLVDSSALREQLLDALKASGVSPVAAGVGEPFDSSRHRAVGTIPTTDPVNDNTVAETQRSGYVDRGKRVRYPEVLVFKWSEVGE